MEQDAVHKGPRSRIALLIATLALTLVAAAAFGRVYVGREPTLHLMAAAAAAVALAALFERRNVVLATVASAVGLAIAIGLLIYPNTTRYGLPTFRTWDSVRHSWAAVGRAARSEAPPAIPLDPLILASITAMWAAAFAAHALAVRAASPFLALLPPGALLAFASLVVNDGSRPAYVIAFLGAAMALLYADGLRRVGQWGPIAVWSGPRRWRTASSSHTRSARRVALTCLGIALFAPGILPGFKAAGIISVGPGANPDAISIDPVVDIRPSLLRNPELEVFTVKSDRPAYWRFTALDQFTGRLWLNDDAYVARGRDTTGGRLEPDTKPQSNITILRQEFRYSRLVQPQLVAAYDPVDISLEDAHLRYDPRNSTIVEPNGTRKDLTYTVRSRFSQPTAEQLRGIEAFDPLDVERYTQLPADTPGAIRETALELTKDESTPYGRIMAIQRHLRTFRYDESVQPGHGVNDIVRFLEQTKAGYCEQFAGSMAVLLRSLGIPARVAVGFTAGTYDKANDVWRVTTRNAHTWVEVAFPRFGWLAFEPTPGRGNPSASTYQVPPLRAGTTECLTIPGSTRLSNPCAGQEDEPNAAGQPAEPSPGRTGATEPKAESPAAGGKGGIRSIRWPAVGPWAALGVVLLFLIGVPTVKTLRRRRALAEGMVPKERVLAAFRLLSDRGADLGFRRRSSETPWEYRSRLRARIPFSDGHLDRLTVAAARAFYSDREFDAEQADAVVADYRQATQDMQRWAGITRRVTGLYRVRGRNRP